jgi:hypothetical protein
VIVVASGAALQVLTHARQAAVGVYACELELDVLVEELEALVACDLRPTGPSRRVTSRWARSLRLMSTPTPAVGIDWVSSGIDRDPKWRCA